MQQKESSGLAHWVARVWQAWQRTQRAAAELGDPEQVDPIARDLGLNRSEVRTLAGKWPDSLLLNRLDQVKLDAAGLRDTEPQVLRDTQRTCALCSSKRACSRDFASSSLRTRWEEYCPNVVTIRA
jgi:hypothetical protein